LTDNTNTALNHFAFLTADYCTSPQQIYVGGQVQQVWAPGNGETATGYGKDLWHEYAARVDANNSSWDPDLGGYILIVYASSKNLGATTVQVKTGKNTYSCGPFIAPGCVTLDQPLLALERIVLDNGEEYCVQRTPEEPCGIVVDCLTGDERPSFPITDLVLNVIDENGNPVQEPIELGSGGGSCAPFIIRTDLNSDNTSRYCIGRRCY
jgi:hypothetical protein